MGAAIGDILGLAAGVAVSPLPIVAMILVLATPRGRANGILFGVLARCWRRSSGAAGPPRGWSRTCPTGWRASTSSSPAGRWAWAPCCRRSTPRTPPDHRRGATIAGAGLPGGEQAVVLAVFVLIGSVGVLAPLVVYLFAGEGAARTLDSWKSWAATHNAAVMAVLFLVFGFKLVGDGIAVLF